MKAVVAALAGIAMASTPSLAADLFGTAPPMTFPASESPTAEVGSNWYLRGDVGTSLDSVPTLSFTSASVPPPGNAATPLSASSGASQLGHNFLADIGVGYRFNNYIRGDVTYEYRSGPGGSGSSTVVCPYALTGLTEQDPDANGIYREDGYLYNTTNTCSGVVNLQQHNNMVLANGYFDMGTYWGITPYIGAGAGMNVQTTSGTLGYYENANGQVYNANLTPTGTYPQIWVNQAGSPINPQPQIAFTTQNWNRTISSTKYSLAIAFMAGIGIQVTPSATLDIGYRYLNTGASTVYVSSPAAAFLKNSNVSQEIRVGLRYMVD
jgi:opacity protein-like surface antigen